MTKTKNQRLDRLEQTVEETKARDEDLVDITDIYEFLSEVYGGVYTGPRVYITREQFERDEREAPRILEMYKRSKEQANQNKLDRSQAIDGKE